MAPTHTFDHRRHAPATQRNRDPILAVLREVLPSTGQVLEIASGSGEHALYFAAHLSDLIWQPSDPDPSARASIAAWQSEHGTVNLLPPLELDAAATIWPDVTADAMVCINMVHISPWAATVGLMQGASRLLQPGQVLVLYGPYLREGHPLEPSNAAFDADLKQRNSQWGLRSVEAVSALAQEHGLHLEQQVPMPANNLMLVLRRA